ncbi:MAG: 50S ribosomal protein L21 [Bdellovibrionota bacterium]
MYAIIRTGGKQYRAEAGQKLLVEKIDKNLGEEFDLNDVLMVGGDKPLIGPAALKGAKVTVVVTQQDRGPKILILKKKRRKGYRRMNGHRQPFTQLFVLSITAGGQTVKAETKAHVIDPMKKLERMEAHEAKLQALSREERVAKKTAKSQKKIAKKVTAPKKKAKKVVKKKAPAKKKKTTKK